MFSVLLWTPDNKSDRTGKIDTRAVYGMQGREMMAWLTHLQHIRDKNVIFVGILDEKVDEYGRTMYELQIEGSKTGRELPGIVDEVITMAVMPSEEHTIQSFLYVKHLTNGVIQPKIDLVNLRLWKSHILVSF